MLIRGDRFVTALGTCVALGQGVLAGGVTALGWLTLRVVGNVETRLHRRIPPVPPEP